MVCMPNNFPHDSDVLVKGLSFANYEFSWILFPIMSSVSKLQLDEKFKVSYANRFEEGEFRKRIQFMYAGKLMTIKLKYFSNYRISIKLRK